VYMREGKEQKTVENRGTGLSREGTKYPARELRKKGLERKEWENSRKTRARMGESSDREEHNWPGGFRVGDLIP